MRKLLLAAFFIGIVSWAYADCRGVVVAVEKGDQSVIYVKSQYYLDDKLMQTGSPDNVDIVTYFPQTWRKLTKEQMKVKIADDIANRCNQIITYSYSKINMLPQAEVNKDMLDGIFSDQLKNTTDVVGITNRVTEVPIMVDTVGNGTYTEKVYIQANGDKRVEDISGLNIPTAISN